MTHGTRRLPSGRYFAWHGDTKTEHATKAGAQSWVKRQKLAAGKPIDLHLEYAMSQDEVAQIMGISKTRVRQIEQAAIAKIRQCLKDDREFVFWFS